MERKYYITKPFEYKGIKVKKYSIVTYLKSTLMRNCIEVDGRKEVELLKYHDIVHNGIVMSVPSKLLEANSIEIDKAMIEQYLSGEVPTCIPKEILDDLLVKLV